MAVTTGMAVAPIPGQAINDFQSLTTVVDIAHLIGVGPHTVFNITASGIMLWVTICTNNSTNQNSVYITLAVDGVTLISDEQYWWYQSTQVAVPLGLIPFSSNITLTITATAAHANTAHHVAFAYGTK